MDGNTSVLGKVITVLKSSSPPILNNIVKCFINLLYYLHETPRYCFLIIINSQFLALAPYAAYEMCNYILHYVSLLTVMESPNAPTTLISYGVNS